MSNEKITEILDRCKGRFGWVQININTADNYLLMPLTELVEILEKQIPKKPSGDYHSIPHYRCPNCNREVVLYKDSKRYPYCKYCGQRLDWEGI